MKNSVEEKIRISAVSYLNTLPFVYGLKSVPVGAPFELSLDTPAECARKLICDEADLGLVPVAWTCSHGIASVGLSSSADKNHFSRHRIPYFCQVAQNSCEAILENGCPVGSHGCAA